MKNRAHINARKHQPHLQLRDSNSSKLRLFNLHAKLEHAALVRPLTEAEDAFLELYEVLSRSDVIW